MRTRRSFEDGHRRKFLIVVDESQEVESALYYAASRVQRSSGLVVMLYTIEPSELQHWSGLHKVQLEEETAKAKAPVSPLPALGTEEVIREGRQIEEINKLIAEDEDIAILVLGAAVDAKGPGPLGCEVRHRRLPSANYRCTGTTFPRRYQGARLT
jgi:nucleotide-binding universal stress UspA family protein